MSIGKNQYLAFFKTIVRAIKNLMVPLDRARRVVLGTSMERLEHVPRRIRGGITRIRCQLHLRTKFTENSYIYEYGYPIKY